MATCNSCKFFYQDGKAMACRRFPPTGQVLILPREHRISGQVMPVEEQRSFYPGVRGDWWCGEYSVQMATAA